MNDNRNDELMHYGVMGMKWGRRKSKSSSSSTRTGSKTKQPSESKKRMIQNKETRADYRSDKGPKRFNMYNAANSAARTYYRSMRTNNLQTHLKQQAKLDLIEGMIARSERKDSDWSRDYGVGKWAVRYLEMLQEKKASDEQIKEVCKRYWKNSSVRRYYVDICMKKKEYDHVLQILDECILLDKQYRGLISEYSEKKKEIYLLQGNRSAYIEQLWKLVLEHEPGNLELYRELRKQYTADEWLVKREEIFGKLPAYAHVERLYKEEKLYDRLLTYVLNSPGLYALQEYEKVLKNDYPEQILNKYKDEVSKMAVHTSDRKNYAHLVSLLRKTQQMKGGSKLVEQMAAEWKVKYRNRPAMMDELRKL